MNDRVRLTVANTASAGAPVRQLPAIRFLADGGIDEASPATVRLDDSSGMVLWLAQTRNRMGYEIHHAN